MATETADYIEDLDDTRPDGATEYVHEGDNHLKLLKKALKQTFTGFAGGVLCYGSDASGTATYAINPTKALPGYAAGLIVVLTVSNSNTGASTLNISSLGAKTIKLPDGSAIPAGILSTTAQNILIYNGTDFILLFPTSHYAAGAFFDAETSVSSSAGAATFDWPQNNKQKITLTENITSLTLTAPNGPCNLIMKITQGAGPYTITWPASVLWQGGTAPTLSTTNGAVDIVSMYFDGTNYYAVWSGDYQ